MGLTRKGRKVILGTVFAAFVVTAAVCGAIIFKHQQKIAKAPTTTTSSKKMTATTTAKSTTASSSSAAPAKEKAASVLLTFMGDNTLGTDPNFDVSKSLPTVWANNGSDPHYFFKNVAQYFTADDLTVANLETTFTTSNEQADKGSGTVYHFKGDPSLVAALTSSSIEAVTVSNNHIYDYGQTGFDDTIKTLDAAKVGYFGEGYKYTTEKNGIKIGLLGYQLWSDDTAQLEKMKQDIADLRADGCQLVIPYFHWGIERDEYPGSTQVNAAHYAIDNGADLVIGSHPHVIQSMEVYNGKLIAYSMGNFAFGGNSNPADKRSFVLQTQFTVENGQTTASTFKVIPTRISSTESYNDYVPTPYESPEKENVLAYMNSLSSTLNNRITDDFVPIAQ